ncbi:hypothetical protein Cgig2_021331 [Carnegiea gigantea]|uniref:Uncharacterized protein n=1 Tax=Carnegiea gigantea TaxID=171969 RepID=A0A9Q1Q5J7_9CARY|nr:hypothetical protein Cgig2_021331 [Carnegiea gigantea]
MAKLKRILNSIGAGDPKNGINEYKRQRQTTIEKNKRKLMELGIQRTLTSMRRINETIQRQSEENSDEDNEYNLMEYERLHAEFEGVPSDTPRNSMHKTSFEGHVTKTSLGFDKNSFYVVLRLQAATLHRQQHLHYAGCCPVQAVVPALCRLVAPVVRAAPAP